MGDEVSWLDTTQYIERGVANVDAASGSVASAFCMRGFVVPNGVEKGDDCRVVEREKFLKFFSWEKETMVCVGCTIYESG
jgi:hypothetical protein